MIAFVLASTGHDSRKMLVQQPANQTGQRNRHQAKCPIVPPHNAVSAGHKSVPGKVVLEVFKFALLSAEAQLEPPQPLVPNRSPPKIQPILAPSRVPLDGLPHDQVVAAQMLIGRIRGAELIDGL